MLGWFSVALEVFLRKDFGERYLSIVRVLCASIVLSLAVLIGQAVPLLAGDGPPDFLRGIAAAINAAVFQVIWWAFLAMSAYHLWRIYRRNERGEQWYSRSFGISHFSFLLGKTLPALKIGGVTLGGPFVISDWALYCLIEPLGLAVLGLVFREVGLRTVAVFILVGAVSLLLKNLTVYSFQRARMLDIMDSQIEARFMLEALRGSPKEQTQGFSVVSIPTPLDRDRDGIPDTLETSDLAATVRATMGASVVTPPPASVQEDGAEQSAV